MTIMVERLHRQGRQPQEVGEEVEGGEEATYGGGSVLDIIDLNPPSPPTLPISEPSARAVLSGYGIDPLKAL